MNRFARITAVGFALLATACSSDDATSSTTDAAPPVTESTPSTPSTTTEQTTNSSSGPTTTVGSSKSLDSKALVEALASDELAGRDNGSAGSAAAQRLLIDQVAQLAQPMFPDRDGDDRFLQPFSGGTNILATIPGGDLADEWVVIGAHYDHLGSECPSSDPADSICNGATDNATGVAAAISVVRSIVADGVPRRSVLLALWDAEEDGLAGSAAYVNAPTVPLAQTVGYVNFDIQGASLLPSLASTTVAVGAETGGPGLVEAVTRAAGASTLETVQLSLLFGQGRSDHANFAGAGVPSVFFTDANTGCYHTAQDDVRAVDFAKLDQQIATATALSRDLVATDTPPVFDPAAPASTYDDAVSMLEVTKRGQPDFGRLDPEAASSSAQYVADLQAIVESGPDLFDDSSVATLLSGAVTFVEALTRSACVGATA